MKKIKLLILYLLVCLFLNTQIRAQTPYIVWQKSFGGSEADYFRQINPINNNSLLITGNIRSNDANVPNYHKYDDAWVLKIDTAGNTLATTAIGGNKSENISGLIVEKNSILLGVYANSTTDGDFYAIPDTLRILEWLVETSLDLSINPTKAMVTKPIHPNVFEPDGYRTSFKANNNHYYLYGGYNNSGFNLPHEFAYIAKINKQGAILWERKFNETGFPMPYDYLTTAFVMPNGAIIGAGFTESSGDSLYKDAHGKSDAFLLKYDVNGQYQWHGLFGTSGYEILWGISAFSKGVVGVGHSSNELNESQVYIVAVNHEGQMLWQKTYGGSSGEAASYVCADTDGGILVVGNTSSTDGDVRNKFDNSADIWVLKLDTEGNIVWQKTLGGSNSENGKGIYPDGLGNYYVCGYAYSNDGHLTQNYGKSDGWVVKLSSLPIPKPTITALDSIICLQPITITASQAPATFGYRWNTGDTTQTIIINKPGAYQVNYIKWGDTLSISKITSIEIKPYCKQFALPTAFSPNNDGINDRFALQQNQAITQAAQLTIYNRWGQRVFSGNAFEGWSGALPNNSPAPAGVYVYILTYINPLSGLTETTKGNITLLR
ncbi:MAG: gliding motility-associated C-terminal domain-containing protein [Sphingobacteriales bacterium]|jgi:gliding motility-associated-like protein|nr:gliding motility-associated C-terminal domain-containing protein [Sphingobacteriales bacterium]MBP9140125.1 gliding motility-associated C-terminal domain-containing protein [Chitinophagales bacterium]MDA0198239.1 gliding motility-associated C-terminal domain-containing protein [Bacteroidota bacterium]MBK6889986.1 gliding motility-associated C-terminal domain-containing protein [Sphingobacteriales bacterium]MBK7527491.1 gliding motility-associated C-terminal domain-containing protein [Sphingo